MRWRRRKEEEEHQGNTTSMDQDQDQDDVLLPVLRTQHPLPGQPGGVHEDDPSGVRIPVAVIESVARRAGERAGRDGGDAVTARPFERFADGILTDEGGSTRPAQRVYGGFLRDLALFDAECFGVSALEARTTDPQQRILLECCLECGHGDGGKGVGVFVGCLAMEYALALAHERREAGSAYSITGAGLSVASGRVSFVFGLRGPAVTVDTACSSSLVALDLARRHVTTATSPRSPERALACGSNALVSRKTFQLIHRVGMLAPDGRCKTLDASANGYTRAEAVQCLLLSSSSSSSSSAGGVVAVVGGAVNQDGRSASLTAPSGPAQQEMLLRALEDAMLGALDVEGLQMHGTGSRLGDPIELTAAQGAISLHPCGAKAKGSALYLSASKTTLGHAEAAAGLNGVLQACSVASRARAAPFIHLRTLNPLLRDAFDGLRQRKGVSFAAPRQDGPVCRTKSGAVAHHGVSAFAFQGTNVHVVLGPAGVGEGYGAAARGRAVVWDRRYFWHSPPNHPLLKAFETAANAHGDLVAEARVDLSCPSLSYLRQFLLAGRSVLGGAAYLDACSFLTGWLGEGTDRGARTIGFALTHAVFGPLRVLGGRGAGCCHLTLAVDPSNGLASVREAAVQAADFSCFIDKRGDNSEDIIVGGNVGCREEATVSVPGAAIGPRRPAITEGPGARPEASHRPVGGLAALRGGQEGGDQASSRVLDLDSGLGTFFASEAAAPANPWDPVSPLAAHLAFVGAVAAFALGASSGGDRVVGWSGTESRKSEEAPLEGDWTWRGRSSFSALGVQFIPIVLRQKMIIDLKAKLNNKNKISRSVGGEEEHGKTVEEWEGALLDIVETLVGERVGPEESLHESAVDSFTAEEVATLVGRATGLSVSATLCFDYPTVRLMARHVHARLREERQGEASSAGGSGPPRRPARPAVTLGRRDAAVVTVRASAALLPSGRPGSSGGSRRDRIGTIPLARWDLEHDSVGASSLPRFGGFVRLHKWLDSQVFNVSAAEAEHIDCRQCHLLHLAREVLFLSSGHGHDQGHAEGCGVYVGIQAMPADNPFRCRLGLTGYHGTGTSMSVACGRLSYVFGLRGPSLCVDTACSSSLIALHLAAMAARGNAAGPGMQCDQALACGAHCYQSDKGFQVMMHAGMLAPDGRCKTLDASANGYTRAEAVQCLLLSSSSSAGGVVAVVGGAVNQDGRSASLTAPSGPAQQEMLLRALEDAMLGALDMDGIEMHGTGTLLGDPIEIGALSTIFDGCRGEASGRILHLSGVKSTVGHAEAAAGLNGVLQVCSAASQTRTAPFIHLRMLNPYLHNAFDGLRQRKGVSFAAPRQDGPVCRTKSGAVAHHGVSAFAFQGTNVHVVLGSAETNSGSAAARRVFACGAGPRMAWSSKFFWHSQPNHPLLKAFETAANAHGDLVAEARVDLSCPSLSYLRQFLLAGRSVLGGAAYLDACGSLASSLVDGDCCGPDRSFALADAIFGEPLVLEEEYWSRGQRQDGPPPCLRIEVHAALGLANAGFSGPHGSSPATAFACDFRRSHKSPDLSQGRGAARTAAIPLPQDQHHGGHGGDATTVASLRLCDLERVSEHVLHPLIFENAALCSSAAGQEPSGVFPTQIAFLGLTAALGEVSSKEAAASNAGEGGLRISVAGRVVCAASGIAYLAPRRQAAAPPAKGETSEAGSLRAKQDRLSPASDEDYNAYALEDFEPCCGRLLEGERLVRTATAARGGGGGGGGGEAGAGADFVKRLVCEVAGEEEISDEEPLIGAGLDSIASLELRTKLQDLLGVALAPTLLQDHPTISSLRSLVESTSQTLSRSSQDECGQSATSGGSEHFRPALYLPLLFKETLIMSCRKHSDSFLPAWYPPIVWLLYLLVPIFLLAEKIQHWALYVLDGKYRQYEVKSIPPAGAGQDHEPSGRRHVPLTQDDASMSHVYVSACLEFDRLVSEVDLCASLALALGHFPSLAGRLSRRGRGICLVYGGEEDHVRVLAHEYRRRSDMHFKSGMIQETSKTATPGWLQTLNTLSLHALYLYRCAKPNGHPCLKVYVHQNLRGTEGRTLVTVRWNHAAADGSTIHRFLGAWGMADRGMRVLTAQPGPHDCLSDRRHALVAGVLTRESSSHLYFPSRGLWSPPYNSVLVRFTRDEIRFHLGKTDPQARVTAVDVVSTLLWVAMANTRYPTSTEVSGDKWVEYASWHPKLSFLVDLRNHIPELQCFTGNLVRATEPFCPMADPLADLGIVVGADITGTAASVSQNRRGAKFSMEGVEATGRLPGVPLCLQEMQRVMMDGEGGGPTLLVNDLTSFHGPFNFSDAAAEVSGESYSSDWSPGDATLMTKLEDVDFTQFTQNDFWFAHLKNDGEGGISCALTTFA